MSEDKIIRISPFLSGSMIAIALIIDGLQALLTFLIVGIVLNPFISFFAYLLFWMWFSANGVKFARAGGTLGIALLIELIPILNSLPAWTLDIVVLLGWILAQDLSRIITPRIADFMNKMVNATNAVKDKTWTPAKNIDNVINSGVKNTMDIARSKMTSI